MKRILLLVLSIVMVTTVMAENVSPEQALEQARNFVLKREATGSRKVRRAPGTTTPKLTMTASKVSGLYVFNIADGGFVVVSSDDRTTPILGFSDSGSLDPEQMPANMKAWLQGYADEIAWLEQHGITTVTVSKNGSGPRRAGNHSTVAIAPLLSTTWNQGKPYNNFCPEYSQGNRAVTGCVATAMAQVMKYHQWPTAATTTIPGYTTATYGLSLSSLSATTFDWANMKDSYRNNNWTSTEANAVAKLMQYCGWSVQMDYGPSSGSNSRKVADALKNYFDYKATTQVVSRSLYTTAKWADLIYHELANDRPVVYGGQSSGGGHEFVCDGYKYESGIDFFHINWGWGGMSDNYFVLSALDPDQQGIGGSTSNDGYHRGQDAVIGIQKSTDNGTVANITPNVINLRMNSMTLSKSEVTVNTEVTVTMNITNNSTDDFEGDIYLGRKIVIDGQNDDYVFLEGNNFTIPAGQTVDCVIPFTPTEKGTYDFVFFWPNDRGSYSTYGIVEATLTVVEFLSPNDIAVTPKATSAIVSWTGNDRATSYNVRYRIPGREPIVFFDDFESGLGKWTIYAEGDKPFESGWVSVKPATGGLNFDAHSGTTAASAWSWNGDAFNANNWLVTPQMVFGKTLKFWVRTASAYPDEYEVLLSNTGNAIADFTVTLQGMAAAPTNDEWNEVTIDLSAYEGQQGYIAIHHVDYDANFLLIDDFGVYTEGITASEWTELSTQETSIQLTGLSPKTTYEYQIQSVYNGGLSVWTESATFTTLPLVELGDEATNNGEKIVADNGKTTSVVLAGRTLYKDGNWNTICLPFNVTLEGSPLAGATAKTLTDATMVGAYVTLYFSDAVTTLEAGKPYLIKWESGDDLVEPVFNDVTISAPAGATIEKASGHVKFTGYYDAFDIDTPANDDIYYLATDNTLKHTGKKRTLRACRAYFQFSENIVSSAPQFMLDFGDGQTTSIDASKIVDSQFEADTWYSIDGVKLDGKPIKKGFYIHNGKKEVVK